MAETTQDVLIKVKSDVNPIKAFNAEIRKTKEEVARTSLEFGKQSKEFDIASNKLKSLQSGFTNLKKTVSEAGNSVKMSKFQLLEFGENLTVVSAGIIAATSALTSFAKESIIAGANLTVLRSNFKGTQQDLELFGKATTGNLGEAALIRLSNRATELGFAMKDQALLFDLAENAADSYGGSIEENFDRVVNAISKGGKGLEALGVSTNLFKERANELSLSLYGLAYKDLDSAEKRMVGFKTIVTLTGGSLQKLNDKLPDVGDNIANMSRAWETFKEKLGESIIAQTNFNNGQTDFSKKAGESAEAIGKFIGWLSKIGGYIQTAEVELLKLVAPFDKISDSIQYAIDKTKELFGVQKQGESLKILTLDERVNAATDKILSATIPDINVTAGRKTKSSSNGSRSAETEKQIKYISDKFAGLILFDIAKNVNSLLPQSAYKVNGSAVSLPGLGNEPIFPGGKIKPIDNTAENAAKTLEDTQTLYGVISQTMTLIGITTDSFLGKLVSGFGTVLTIMESIKTVNSILSFIPGFADGGIMPGVSWVGERGKELMFNPGAYVMNHSDSMKFMNSNSSGSNVNVYLSGNIDVKAQLRKENKKYRAITIKQ